MHKELSEYFPFTSVEEVKRANKYAGKYFFNSGTMWAFKSRVLDHLYGGRYFITSEDNGNGRRYTIRHVKPDASIETVGEPGQYYHAAQAKRIARELVKDDRVRVCRDVKRNGKVWSLSSYTRDGYIIVTAVPREFPYSSEGQTPSNEQYRDAAYWSVGPGVPFIMVERGSRYGHPRIYRIVEPEPVDVGAAVNARLDGLASAVREMKR